MPAVRQAFVCRDIPRHPTIARWPRNGHADIRVLRPSVRSIPRGRGSGEILTLPKKTQEHARAARLGSHAKYYCPTFADHVGQPIGLPTLVSQMQAESEPTEGFQRSITSIKKTITDHLSAGSPAPPLKRKSKVHQLWWILRKKTIPGASPAYAMRPLEQKLTSPDPICRNGRAG